MGSRMTSSTFSDIGKLQSVFWLDFISILLYMAVDCLVLLDGQKKFRMDGWDLMEEEDIALNFLDIFGSFFFGFIFILGLLNMDIGEDNEEKVEEEEKRERILSEVVAFGIVIAEFFAEFFDIVEWTDFFFGRFVFILVLVNLEEEEE